MQAADLRDGRCFFSGRLSEVRVGVKRAVAARQRELGRPMLPIRPMMAGFVATSKAKQLPCASLLRFAQDSSVLS